MYDTLELDGGRAIDVFDIREFRLLAIRCHTDINGGDKIAYNTVQNTIDRMCNAHIYFQYGRLNMNSGLIYSPPL